MTQSLYILFIIVGILLDLFNHKIFFYFFSIFFLTDNQGLISFILKVTLIGGGHLQSVREGGPLNYVPYNVYAP